MERDDDDNDDDVSTSSLATTNNNDAKMQTRKKNRWGGEKEDVERSFHLEGFEREKKQKTNMYKELIFIIFSKNENY